MGIVLILGAAVLALALMAKKSGSGQRAPGTAVTSGEIATAVQTAMRVETDPNKLDEFADSLEPDYHDLANQLHARATLLRAAHGVSPPPAPSGGMNETPPPAGGGGMSETGH